MMRLHAQSIPTFSPMAFKRPQAKKTDVQSAQTLPAPMFAGLTKHIQGRHWLNTQTVHTLTFPTPERPEPAIKTGNVGHIPKAFLEAAGCSPQEIYTGLSELADWLRPLKSVFPFPLIRFQLGRTGIPIECKALDGGDFGEVYLLKVNQEKFVFKVYHKLTPQKLGPNETHGPIAENVSGCFLSGFPLSYVVRYDMGNVHHGWSVLEYIDSQKDYRQRVNARSGKKLPLRHNDINEGTHVQDIIVDLGGTELSLPMNNLADFKKAMLNPNTRDLAIKSFSSLPTPDREPAMLWATDQGLVNAKLTDNLDLFNLNINTEKRRIINHMIRDPKNLPLLVSHLYALAPDEKFAALKALIHQPTCNGHLPYNFAKDYIPQAAVWPFFQEMLEVETLQEKAFQLIPRLSETEEGQAVALLLKTPALSALTLKHLTFFRKTAQDKMIEALWKNPENRMEVMEALPRWRGLDEVSSPYIQEVLQQKDATLAFARGAKYGPTLLKELAGSMLVYPEVLPSILPLAEHLPQPYQEKILEKGLQDPHLAKMAIGALFTTAFIHQNRFLSLALSTPEGRKEMGSRVSSINKTKLPDIFDTLLSHEDSIILASDCLRYMIPGKAVDEAYDRVWAHPNARSQAAGMISCLSRDKQVSAVLAALQEKPSRIRGLQAIKVMPFPLQGQAIEATTAYPECIPYLVTEKLISPENYLNLSNMPQQWSKQERLAILLACLKSSNHSAGTLRGMQAYLTLAQQNEAFQILSGIELQESGPKRGLP